MQFDGPWRKVAHDMYMMDGDEPIAIENAKGDTVCNNAPFYPTAIDAKYADLIAAAPEMLDALKEISAAVFGTSLGDEPDVYSDYDRLSSLCALVSSAIAKAEGHPHEYHRPPHHQTRDHQPRQHRRHMG